ncbi:MAG: agmatinase family protein, partial [Bacteroidota bacterium]|nr:agmatinase family protein [Bacteroidota bacterium]
MIDHTKSKGEKIKGFDPNGPGVHAGIYGLPFSAGEADIVLIPVPWEVTTSYGHGTADGPEAIFNASFQVDLFHREFPELWKSGIFMDEVPEALREQSIDLKKKIEKLHKTADEKKIAKAAKLLALVNQECEVMNQWVQQRAAFWLDQGKMVGLVGGDHSTPLGFFRAQAARHQGFGILHIDAHLDLRIAFEGFTYSHASIVYNALPIEQITKVVSVGIRDICEEEQVVLDRQKGRVVMHHGSDLRREQFEGATWKQQVDRIIGQLPQKVHVTFDIDGLDPKLCPNTGTPVPGGFEFEEAAYLLSRVAESGRQLIGFDLVEV